MKQTIILLFCALTAQAAAQNNIPQEDSLKALALKGVTVKGERPRVTMKDGRFTIDMQAVRNKKIAANAHELIKELPLVSSTTRASVAVAESSVVAKGSNCRFVEIT